ncbi:hypothetical protein ABKV19_015784 [Rosa sericea]
MKETGLNKCARSGSCNVFGSKACREKMRRDRLNDNRTFVGVDFFSVFQKVCLQTKDQRVSNIVEFSDAVGELKVEKKRVSLLMAAATFQVATVGSLIDLATTQGTM